MTISNRTSFLAFPIFAYLLLFLFLGLEDLGEKVVNRRSLQSSNIQVHAADIHTDRPTHTKKTKNDNARTVAATSVNESDLNEITVVPDLTDSDHGEKMTDKGNKDFGASEKEVQKEREKGKGMTTLKKKISPKLLLQKTAQKMTGKKVKQSDSNQVQSPVASRTRAALEPIAARTKGKLLRKKK